MNNNKSGFSLIELLIGLSVSVAIFIVATSLMINVFSSTTKSRQHELLYQVKNDLQNEFSNSVRWAGTISSIGGNFKVDDTTYVLKDGRIFKDESPITPEAVEITSFEVLRHTPAGSAPSESGSGLTAQYFNDRSLSELAFSQQEFLIDFDWGAGSPDTLIGADTFSARYVGQIKAPVSGEYTFYTESDEGARLWIDDDLLIDDWISPGFDTKSGKVSLEAGEAYDIRLLFYEDFGASRLRLSWEYPGVARQVVPTSYLYPRSGPVSLEIKVEMKDKSSIALVDTLTIILSPRSGSVSTVE